MKQKDQPVQGCTRKIVGAKVQIKVWASKDDTYEELVGRIVQVMDGPEARRRGLIRTTKSGKAVGIKIEGRDKLEWKMRKHVRLIEERS